MILLDAKLEGPQAISPPLPPPLPYSLSFPNIQSNVRLSCPVLSARRAPRLRLRGRAPCGLREDDDSDLERKEG